MEDLRGAENLRGANQVMHATGICDLRSVVLVRRAFQVVPIHMHKEEAPPDVFWSTEEQGTLDDEEDEGGDAFSVFASTATAGPGAGSTTTSQQDRIRTTKMRRCFELLLNSGHVVRFEVRFFLSACEPLFGDDKRIALILLIAPSSIDILSQGRY